MPILVKHARHFHFVPQVNLWAEGTSQKFVVGQGGETGGCRFKTLSTPPASCQIQAGPPSPPHKKHLTPISRQPIPGQVNFSPFTYHFSLFSPLLFFHPPAHTTTHTSPSPALAYPSAAPTHPAETLPLPPPAPSHR